MRQKIFYRIFLLYTIIVNVANAIPLPQNNLQNFSANKQQHLRLSKNMMLHLSKSPKNPVNTKMTATLVQNDNNTPSSILAVGKLHNQKGDFPLIALSDNNGNNWSYVLTDKTPKLPSDYLGLDMFTDPTISCSNQDCVATMIYQRSGFPAGRISPLFAISHDGGHHWSYTLDSQSPQLPKEKSVDISEVSCAQKTCVAVGSTQSSPILMVSQNAGDDWKFIGKDEITSPPKDFSGGFFNSVHCEDSFCIAAGHYFYDDGDANNSFPLIAISSDKGMHWTYNVDFQKSPGILFTVHCYDQHCAAGGQSYPADHHDKALLLTSQDAGMHWNPVEVPRLSDVPDNLEYSILTSIHCDSNGCMVSGGYFSSNNHDFTFLNGIGDKLDQNWHFSTEPIVPASLPDLDHHNGDQCVAFDSGLNCSGSTCVAAGACYLSIEKFTPFVAMSWDKGVSWQFPVDLNTPALPDGFSAGRFMASTFVY